MNKSIFELKNKISLVKGGRHGMGRAHTLALTGQGAKVAEPFTPLKPRPLPPAPTVFKAIGMGVVVLGLAAGTGELILWPHLVTKFGLGLLWGALLGITFQYFINQEVARHALATGESFFTSSARLMRHAVFLWLFFAIVLYVWPGWAGALGTILVSLFGFGTHYFWAYVTLLLVAIITFFGKYAYQTLEKTLKIVVPLFFALLVLVSFKNLTPFHLKEMFLGFLNFGWLPAGVDLNVFFGAVVFAGAGGLLNLCASLWSRDKQWGMGCYMGKIVNPLKGGPEEPSYATGFYFPVEHESLKEWKKWLRIVRIDQGLIFWFFGLVTLALLSVNAYAVLAPRGLVPEGLDVAVLQAEIFGEQWGAAGFKLFLVMAFLMLFGTMWAVISAFTRIVSDILYVNSCAGPFQKQFSFFRKFSVHQLFYGIVFFLLVVQAALIPFRPPLFYLTLSAVLGGLSMAVYVPIILYLNNRKLPKELRPSWLTNMVLSVAFLFYAGFALASLYGLIFA